MNVFIFFFDQLPDMPSFCRYIAEMLQFAIRKETNILNYFNTLLEFTVKFLKPCRLGGCGTVGFDNCEK